MPYIPVTATKRKWCDFFLSLCLICLTFLFLLWCDSVLWLLVAVAAVGVAQHSCIFLFDRPLTSCCFEKHMFDTLGFICKIHLIRIRLPWPSAVCKYVYDVPAYRYIHNVYLWSNRLIVTQNIFGRNKHNHFMHRMRGDTKKKIRKFNIFGSGNEMKSSFFSWCVQYWTSLHVFYFHYCSQYDVNTHVNKTWNTEMRRKCCSDSKRNRVKCDKKNRREKKWKKKSSWIKIKSEREGEGE